MNKNYEILKSIQNELLNEISLDFKRNSFDEINWDSKIV